MTARIRIAHAATNRTQLGHMQEVDNAVLRTALNQQVNNDRVWLTTVITLGRWNDDTLHAFGADHDQLCQ